MTTCWCSTKIVTMAYVGKMNGPNQEYCTKRRIMGIVHIRLYRGAENCTAKHERYIWPAINYEESLVLADSLLKRVRALQRTAVYAIPGAKIERFTTEISRNKIDVSFQKAILVHLGTNNLEKDTAEEICEKMAVLVNLIRAKNPQCKLLISGIIMRPQDEETAVVYTRKGKPSLAIKRRVANDLIQAMLRERGAFQMKTWVPLMNGPIANPDMYWRDGLHLSDEGMERITEYIINVLGRFLPKLPWKCPTRMGLI